MAAKKTDKGVLAVMSSGQAVRIVDIDSVKPDPKNTRLHSQRNLDTIKHSLAEYGQQRPILVTADGIIVAGNGTHQAAKDLGWPHIAVTQTDLTGEAARMYAITDNRAAELASWDYGDLHQELTALRDTGIDITKFGWSTDEFDALVPASEYNNATESAAKLAQEPVCQKYVIIKIEKVLTSDTDKILGAVNQALQGTDYKACAY